MSNSNSMRSFWMETKSKTMRACLRLKMDNIILIGQYRVGHEISQTQHYPIILWENFNFTTNLILLSNVPLANNNFHKYIKSVIKKY